MDSELLEEGVITPKDSASISKRERGTGKGGPSGPSISEPLPSSWLSVEAFVHWLLSACFNDDDDDDDDDEEEREGPFFPTRDMGCRDGTGGGVVWTGKGVGMGVRPVRDASSDRGEGPPPEG
jgi:hypothetical protein